MKKILLSLLFLSLISLNEFTLTYLSPDNQIGTEYITKIRFFNLILLITLLLVYLYYGNYVKQSLTKRIFFFIF